MHQKHRITLAIVIATLLVVPLSMSLASTAGRDYSRCIGGCNASRQACSIQCENNCSASFPNDPAARSVCLSQCKEACASQARECKDKCKAIKNGQSPSEP